MALGFIMLLGGLSVILTGIGTYRFTSYFHRNDPLFAGTMSFALTLVYIIGFEFILLGIGLLSIALPAAFIGRKTNLLSGSSIRGLPDFSNKSTASNKRVDRSSNGKLDAYSDYRCPNCNDFFETGDQYCGSCGDKLPEGSR